MRRCTIIKRLTPKNPPRPPSGPPFASLKIIDSLVREPIKMGSCRIFVTMAGGVGGCWIMMIGGSRHELHVRCCRPCYPADWSTAHRCLGTGAALHRAVACRPFPVQSGHAYLAGAGPGCDPVYAGP